jgi:pimeloyl-ACP methyl ester carboxylesterase
MPSTPDAHTHGSPPVPDPRLEGQYRIGRHRRLGFAEYGDPLGRTVFWFHGTPGGRRQMSPEGAIAAARMGLRIFVLERPGIGYSTKHLYDNVLGYADDVGRIADHLGIDEFGIVGLSGGGPYALACAYRFPDRVIGAAVLGGVAPTVGPDAVNGGAVGFARRCAPLLEVVNRPLAFVLHRGVRVLVPFRDPLFGLYVAVSPEGDKRVFRRPEMKEMFIDDIMRSMRTQAAAPVFDLVLFTRDWGFRLGDIRVPIRFWHGDADHIVPLAHVQHLAGLVPDSELRIRPGESHLGCLAAADEVFSVLLDLWPFPDLSVDTDVVGT